MSCRRAEPSIADYLAGTLDSDATRELQGHLAACADCRAEVEGLAAVWAGLGLVADEEPGEGLRSRFYARLEVALAAEEERGAGLAGRWGDRLARWFGGQGHPFRQGLAAAVVLAVGIGIGALGAGGGLGGGGRGAAPRPEDPATAGEIAELRQEVGAMSRLLALSLLAQDSASARLKGVSLGERTGGDQEMTQALLATLNDDPSVNVRLAAVDALARFADRPAVADGLLESLPRQTSPLVQLALVDAVLATDRRRAVPALTGLLHEPDLDRQVRERVESRLAQLG
jgi:HEAT repeats/Putative zinc-finger